MLGNSREQVNAASKTAGRQSLDRSCDSHTRGSKAGRGRKEKGNHEDREDLKGASAFASSAWAAFGQQRCAHAEEAKALAFHASGEAFFEVFEVFVVRFFCQCLDRTRS
jgi:hypothetical protein